MLYPLHIYFVSIYYTYMHIYYYFVYVYSIFNVYIPSLPTATPWYYPEILSSYIVLSASLSSAILSFLSGLLPYRSLHQLIFNHICIVWIIILYAVRLPLQSLRSSGLFQREIPCNHVRHMRGLFVLSGIHEEAWTSWSTIPYTDKSRNH